MSDEDTIIEHYYTKIDNYLIILTKLDACRLNTKERRGNKYGYVVSCVDLKSEHGQKAFIKRIHKRKDACKYFRLLPAYCIAHGKQGLMKIWDEIDKSFDIKVTLNKDYIIYPAVAYEHALKLYEDLGGLSFYGRSN